MPNVSVGVGLSQEPDTRLAAQQAVREALRQAGLRRAPWALCFFTGAHLARADAIRHIVMEETGCASLCGCSAVGVLGAGKEVEGGAGIAVLVGDAAGVESRSMLLPDSGEGLTSLRAMAVGQPGTPLVFALPDSLQVDHARLQERWLEDLPDIPVLGAGSTDDGAQGISLQVGMEGVRSRSMALLGLFGPLESAVGITQSCGAVGEPHFITQAREHILVELDGRPALQAFIEQGQALGMETLQQAVQQLLFGFPLDPEHPQFLGESCLVRSLVGFDQATHGLVVPFPVRSQTTMGFMHRSAASAEQDMRRMVEQTGQRLSGPPDFGVYFNCAARGQGLYGQSGVDVGIIHGQLGDFPLIGMFGGFELATALGLPQVYTYTGVLVLVRVREPGWSRV